MGMRYKELFIIAKCLQKKQYNPHVNSLYCNNFIIQQNYVI